MSQESTKRLVANNVIEPEIFQRFRRRQIAENGHIAEPLVRPKLMVVAQQPVEI